jgi:preprotein translocase subunit SecD
MGELRFHTWSFLNAGRPLAILVDGRLVSAPSIRDPISGPDVLIAGRMTMAEAQTLARTIVPGSK